jgi:hypothetical protein
MGGWIVEHEGKWVTVPFDDYPAPSPHQSKLSNDVALTFDEADFKSRFGNHAIWVTGKGEYAVLAYCGGELTITRWPTLEQAVTAKRTIDGGGCGGGCAKVHLIMHFDPANPGDAANRKAVEDYLARRAPT